VCSIPSPVGCGSFEVVIICHCSSSICPGDCEPVDDRGESLGSVKVFVQPEQASFEAIAIAIADFSSRSSHSFLVAHQRELCGGRVLRPR